MSPQPPVAQGEGAGEGKPRAILAHRVFPLAQAEGRFLLELPVVAAVIGPHLPGESCKSKWTNGHPAVPVGARPGTSLHLQGTRSSDGHCWGGFPRAQGPGELGRGWVSGSVTEDTRTFQSCKSAAHISPQASGPPLGLRVWFTAQVWCSGHGQEEPQSLLHQAGSFLSQFHFCHPSADPAKQELPSPAPNTCPS